MAIGRTHDFGDSIHTVVKYKLNGWDEARNHRVKIEAFVDEKHAFRSAAWKIELPLYSSATMVVAGLPNRLRCNDANSPKNAYLERP
jgi:hypothetical protein